MYIAMQDIDKKIEEITKDYPTTKSKKFYITLCLILLGIALVLAFVIIYFMVIYK